MGSVGKKQGIKLVVIGLTLVLMILSLFIAKEKSSEIIISEDTLAVSQNIGEILGPISLIVPISAVVLAFITKEVLSSLFVSIFYGHLLLNVVNTNNIGKGLLFNTFDSGVRSIIEVVADFDKASIIILCLVLGGFVGIINSTGAFKSLAKSMIKRIKTRKHVSITGILLGMAIFFDDYANSLIVGPVMRSVTDKFKISREKLAYIVDSTAAPISSIAIISSWIATEVAAIQSGLDLAGVEASAYQLFLFSIPYNFYNFLALIFIFINAISGREYGPMLKAESRALAGYPLALGSKWKEKTSSNTKNNSEAKDAGVFVAVTPIVFLCIFAFVGFYLTGRETAIAKGLLSLSEGFSLNNLLVSLGNANTVLIILEASIAACIFAIILGILSKSLNFVKGVIAWQEGATDLLVTVILLVLAWSLSNIVNELGTVYFLVDFITMNVQYWLVPTLIFVICCLISFGIGSYGCMAIVVPMVVPIAYSVVALNKNSTNESQFVVACIASVLSGSVFGDHCSPITDTTILSSMGAGCDNLDHAKTQLPYAITIAIIATVSGSLLAGFGISYLVSYPIAIVLICLVFYIFGKTPNKGLYEN